MFVNRISTSIHNYMQFADFIIIFGVILLSKTAATMQKKSTCCFFCKKYSKRKTYQTFYGIKSTTLKTTWFPSSLNVRQVCSGIARLQASIFIFPKYIIKLTNEYKGKLPERPQANQAGHLSNYGNNYY